MNETSTIVLGPKAIPVRDNGSGCLICRVSAGSSLAANAYALLTVKNVVVSDEEPDTVFYEQSNLAGFAITSINAFPDVFTASWYSRTGSMVQVQLSVIYGSTGGGTTDLVLAADLVLRNG